MAWPGLILVIMLGQDRPVLDSGTGQVDEGVLCCTGPIRISGRQILDYGASGGKRGTAPALRRGASRAGYCMCRAALG